MKSLKTANLLKLKQMLILNDISEITHRREDKGKKNGFRILYLQVTRVILKGKNCNFYPMED